MSIGENIRKLRKNMKDGTKLTQEQLAEKLGVSFQAVSAWERDEYLPETENVLNLMKALDVSADVVQVPFEGDEYQVQWLGDSAGLLQGSARPGEGVSVLTGHNHLSGTVIVAVNSCFVI